MITTTYYFFINYFHENIFITKCYLKGCGYGCQLHHVVYCFIVAYATERTLILRSKNWRYSKGGWQDVFLPLSDTCLLPNGETSNRWPGNH